MLALEAAQAPPLALADELAGMGEAMTDPTWPQVMTHCVV